MIAAISTFSWLSDQIPLFVVDYQNGIRITIPILFSTDLDFVDIFLEEVDHPAWMLVLLGELSLSLNWRREKSCVSRRPRLADYIVLLADPLIDNNIDIDISQRLPIDIDIDIDIFRIALSISISISIFSRIALSISISISIFSKMTISISISISIFFKSVDISTIDIRYRYIEQG